MDGCMHVELPEGISRAVGAARSDLGDAYVRVRVRVCPEPEKPYILNPEPSEP